MSDKNFALTVTLDGDLSDEITKRICDAVKMVIGVIDVTPHAADLTFYAAKAQVRRELGDALWHVLYPEKK
jgi:hypothetical protein